MLYTNSFCDWPILTIATDDIELYPRSAISCGVISEIRSEFAKRSGTKRILCSETICVSIANPDPDNHFLDKYLGCINMNFTIIKYRRV